MANVLNANDIIIGTGEVFIDGASVGQVDGEVNFTHSKTNYEKKSGFPATTVVSVLTEESASSTFNLLEANLEMLRKLMPEYPEIVENATAETGEENGLAIYKGRHTKLQQNKLTSLTLKSTAGTETTIIGGEAPGSSVTYTLAYVPKSVSAVYDDGTPVTVVESAPSGATECTVTLSTGVITFGAAPTGPVTADYVTVAAVSLTDDEYFADLLAGSFYLLDSSTINPKAVDAEYLYMGAEGKGFGVGGASTTDQTFLVEFVHPRRDKKFRVIKIWKGIISGDFSMNFQEQAEAVVPINVTAVADSSKAPGVQLMTVMDIVKHPYRP